MGGEGGGRGWDSVTVVVKLTFIWVNITWGWGEGELSVNLLRTLLHSTLFNRLN